MFDSFAHGASERLDRPTYHADLGRVYSSGIGFLNKLERGQHFQERGFPSWEAFVGGDWERALSLADERREEYAREIRRASDLGVTHRRLRVVEFPVTPYVQWELFVLRVRVDVGDAIKVIDARDISSIERNHLVPEVVILGDVVMYEVVYDEDGNAAGAKRYTDSSLIRETNAGFDALYERGEGFYEFFDREIVTLAPPRGASVATGFRR
ncbi:MULTISPECIES: DUF6879 family protein [unclassified Streptomyces]|uniref:DUF6879 family protein n=1 Tax=unclassified Streptomyces TaxID=2593676 RepID=UPI000F6D18E9|nr:MULTISPECIES: DUF6879 family protein [unclassified Streptomyces]AZM58890.1 hypothetical protein DLM49_04310 [Streptomyces sp. WAC 01438]RSM93205.1 hypothetical protein DMA10_22210 [Streptomyces sp. WAC 01420]